MRINSDPASCSNGKYGHQSSCEPHRDALDCRFVRCVRERYCLKLRSLKRPAIGHYASRRGASSSNARSGNAIKATSPGEFGNSPSSPPRVSITEVNVSDYFAVTLTLEVPDSITSPAVQGPESFRGLPASHRISRHKWLVLL